MAVMAVDVDGPAAVRERLEAFACDVLSEAVNRPVQLRNGGLYLRGLIEQGPASPLSRWSRGSAGRPKASHACQSRSPRRCCIRS
jgi:hypothetical protein